jgi:hypothetical protein
MMRYLFYAMIVLTGGKVYAQPLLLPQQQNIRLKVSVNQYDYNRYNQLIHQTTQPINNNIAVLKTPTSAWKVVVRKACLPGSSLMDYTVKFYCTKGMLQGGNVAVQLDLDQWSDSNYVLMPGAVYNGNRYAWRRLRYSPKLHDIKDIGADKPIIINDVPKLDDSSGISRIQERSGSMTTPSIGFYDAGRQTVFWLLSGQGNAWGDYQMGIEENRLRNKATVSLASPVVRELYAYQMTNAHTPSWDKPQDFTAGDSVVISFRVDVSKAQSLQGLFDRFCMLRKTIEADTTLVTTLPYSVCMQTLEQKFNGSNYVKEHGYYAVGMRENYLQDWQIGWTGGMISTYPLLYAGADSTRSRVVNNFKWLFPNGIAPSGFYWDACSKGTQWIGGDIRNNHTGNWHLVRKSGDAVWYILKQLMLMKKAGMPVAGTWEDGNKKVCDALVGLWNKHHQLGQFVNSQTGDIVVGGSTSGAIVPAALLLAAAYYQQPEYAKAAQEIGNYYFTQFTQKGIACGGPADALQAFDSESAYALVESYVALYEHSHAAVWLARAEMAAKQFATWVVSYNYRYADTTAFYKAGIKTMGSVYANIQNKHAAPGICTASGLALLKLYKYTGNDLYRSLIQDIAHNITQYMPHPLHPIGKTPIGWVSERINMTDWEGPGTIGYILPISTWAETSLMLTTIEIPGIYIDAHNKVTCFDNVEARLLAQTDTTITLRVKNNTAATAVVSVLAESHKVKVWGENRLFKCPVITIGTKQQNTFVVPKWSGQ